MSVKQSRPKSILSLLITIYFAGGLVYAGIGKPWSFVKGYGPAVTDFLLAAPHVLGSEQARSNASGERTDVVKDILAIVAGIVGNMIGTGAGIGLGIGLDRIFPVGHDAIVPPGVLLGAPAGSIFGSALGVYLARNSRNARGNFGSAVLGSFLGELAAIAIASFVGLGEREGGAVAVLSFAVLPPIGATLGFNGSLPSRSSRAGGGILNLAGGKLGLGVPDIRIRPVFVPGGGKARPGMQFKLNVLSVEP